jgi:hypothetical protein
MNIFDIFSQDQLDQLPLENELAFLAWVRRAREILDERTNRLSDQDENGWRLIQAERYSFVNLIVAIGKRYGIQPFRNYEIPFLSDFDQNDYGNFSSELDHYVAQIVVDETIRKSRQGVELSLASKQKIRDYVARLKDLIDQSDLNPLRRRSCTPSLQRSRKLLERSGLRYWSSAS